MPARNSPNVGLNLNACAFEIVDFASRRVWRDCRSCPPVFQTASANVVGMLVACVRGRQASVPTSTETSFESASVPSTSVESLTSAAGPPR